jgi:hypothetical protein
VNDYGGNRDMAVEISAEVDQSTSLAHQQNAIPFVRELSVTNVSAITLNNLVVTISCDPEFLEPKKIHVQRIEPGSSFTLSVVDVQLKYSFLASVTEAIPGRLTIEVSADDTLVGTYQAQLRLLAYDEWAGLSTLPEIVAAFSQPNHPAIERILSEASRLLAANGLKSSLEGYQAKDKQRAWEIASGIYSAIAGQRIVYCNPPASFEKTGQKIRTVDRIMEGRLASCLDLSMLFCSCLEQAGLRPLVLLKRDHSYVGVWLAEEQLSSAAVDQLQVIRKRAQLHDLIVFEATDVTGDQPATFELAIARANKYLEQEDTFEVAIDIHRAREERILPLPSRQSDGKIIQPATEQSTGSIGKTMVAPAPGIPVDPPVTEESKAEGSHRLEQWKRKLLDLSLRNRLLNFKASKSTIPVLCSDPAELENRLSDGDKLKFRSLLGVIPADDPRSRAILLDRNHGDVVKDLTQRAFRNGEIFSDLAQDVLESRLTEIYRSARSSFEEGGANTLFLALGFLEWKEVATASKVSKAPLILIPVTLERKSVQHGFTLSIHDDEARVNATLLEMLRHDFELEVGGVDPLPTDSKGIDVPLVWRRFSRAVQDIPGWEVTKDVALGLFSFAKYLMWKDLQDRTEVLKRSPVVKHLLESAGGAYPDQGDFPDPNLLDEQRHPTQTFCPLIADSSQMSAVFAAADGKSFVLDGPPGTGKSQTIVNIIAQCLATGKTVLFVSEKLAALEVVHRRLKQLGLDPFCLQLHSAKAKKSEIIEHLGTTWTLAKKQPVSEWVNEAARLARLRQDLTTYVRELHRRYTNGLTPFTATSTVIIHNGNVACEFFWQGPDAHSQTDLERLRELVENLAGRMLEVGDIATAPFRQIQQAQWSPSWERDFKIAAQELHQAADALRSTAAQFGLLLDAPKDYSWAQLRALDELADCFLAQPNPPLHSVEMLIADEFRRKCKTAIAHLKTRKNLWNALEARYDEMALTLPHSTMLTELREARLNWWPKSWLGVRRICKRVDTALISAARSSPDTIETELTRLRAVVEQDQKIEVCGNEIGPVLRQDWCGNITDDVRLERLVGWGEKVAVAVKSLISTFPGDSFRSRCLAFIEQTLESEANAEYLSISHFREAMIRFRAARQAFTSAVKCDESSVFGADDATGLGLRIAAQCQVWESSLSVLRPWCNWYSARTQALKEGLTPMIVLVEQGRVGTQDVAGCFEFNYAQWWLSAVLDKVQVLREFVSREHQRRIDTFVKLDESFSRLTRDYLVASLSGRIPRAQVEPGSGSELAILAREMSKKSRHMAIRTLVQKMPTALSRLAPCFMMSPLASCRGCPDIDPERSMTIARSSGGRSGRPFFGASGACTRTKTSTVFSRPVTNPGRAATTLTSIPLDIVLLLAFHLAL